MTERVTGGSSQVRAAEEQGLGADPVWHHTSRASGAMPLQQQREREAVVVAGVTSLLVGGTCATRQPGVDSSCCVVSPDKVPVGVHVLCCFRAATLPAAVAALVRAGP
jgi:hypothetical protein